MSELGDLYSAWEVDKKKKKIRNKEWSTNYLTDLGIAFSSHNKGTHLVVSHNGHVVDFWPSTGKFIVRGGKSDRGVRNLLKAIGMCEMDNYYVHIISYDTNKVVKEIWPCSKHKAKKIECGIDINLDHEYYFTTIVSKAGV